MRKEECNRGSARWVAATDVMPPARRPASAIRRACRVSRPVALQSAERVHDGTRRFRPGHGAAQRAQAPVTSRRRHPAARPRRRGHVLARNHVRPHPQATLECRNWACAIAHVRACAGGDRHDHFRSWTHSGPAAAKPRFQSRGRSRWHDRSQISRSRRVGTAYAPRERRDGSGLRPANARTGCQQLPRRGRGAVLRYKCGAIAARGPGDRVRAVRASR